MNELLKAWYVDSSPGNNFAQFKCGEIKVAGGISGSSILTGEPVEPPTPPPGTPDEDTASRSLREPGTPLVPGESFGFDMDLAVWFDSESALYNLPTVSDKSSVSISYWYNPWGEGGEDSFNTGTGLLLGSPTKPCCTDIEDTSTCGDCPQTTWDSPPKPIAGATLLEMSPVPFAPGNGASEVWVRTKDTEQWFPASFSKQNWQDITPSEIGEMQGWAHVMITLQVSGSSILCTMWVNDTEICTNKPIGQISGNLPFGLADFQGINGKNHFWNIGGRPDTQAKGKSIIILTGPNYYISSGSYPGNHPGYPQIVEGLAWDCNFVNLGPAIELPPEQGGGMCDNWIQCAEAYGYVQSGGGASWSWGHPCGWQPNNQNPTTTVYMNNACGQQTCGTVSTSTCIISAEGNFTCNATNCGCPPSGPYTPPTNCGSCTCSPIGGEWTVMEYNGKPDDDGFEPNNKDGFQGAVTELWIAPGQAIDWSVAANRYKFHNSETGEDDWEDASLWGQCNLGKKGDRPTGTKPLIYLTGKPDEFNYNRARNMQKLQLYRNSPGGTVGELKAYFGVPVNV